MKSTKELLARVLELLNTGWTQGANARDKNGQRTLVDKLDACCWCLDGAIIAAAEEGRTEEGRTEIDRTRRAVLPFTSAEWPTTLYLWNDSATRTKEEVIAAVTAAWKAAP